MPQLFVKTAFQLFSFFYLLVSYTQCFELQLQKSDYVITKTLKK